MALQHFDRDADPGEVSRFISVHGYASIDDLADAELMDRLANEVEPFVEASDAGRDEYDGQFTRRTGSLIERCPASRELVMHPTVVDTVRHFMGHATAHHVPSGQATMRRGSVLFYDGKVLHGAGANVSNEVRQGVNITYAVGWVRQEENQYLACSQEVARTLDDDIAKFVDELGLN
jgi:hypothetical protein